MKFRFRLKNGKTHEFKLPAGYEVHKAIMWVPKDDDSKKKEVARFIIIPDDVESVEILDDT